MSSKALTDAERASLNLILEDLRYLFEKEEVTQDEIDNVLQNLKSEEVKSYLQNLRYGSKPETALRESFIAGKSILLKYLFGEAVPEVRSNGFIDYLIKDEMGRGIALELKPLFEGDVELDKAGKPILRRLRQKRIKPEDYRDQILKYIQEDEAQFVVLTNLKDWFFYSKELTPREVKPFCTIDFFGFMKEYDVIGNLKDYLDRKEFESIRYDLDKWFLESLKTWVKKLSEVEFSVDDRRKLELIIGLVNKFIFVQTLDDYGVIEFNWIKKRWNYHEQMWQRKGKLMVLEKFFDELDDWFYLYYDTELFKEKILPYIKQNDESVDRLYRNLQLVLGLTYLQVPFGALKGIMQYNFRYIDEDVLGKAYEKFLADIRKEEGVYYTPKYITQYIAENTVGKVFNDLLTEIKEKLEKENFADVKPLVMKFTSIRVLDPACGSGSFLIKAIRIIVKKYKELSQLIESYVKKYSNYAGTLDLPQETRAKLELLSEIRETIGPKNDRELIARILVRHIHGVDLDRRALEVAKVNIWLEAIKLAPKEFRYDKLPPETNYILPNLEMNLCNGDSIVGLPENLTVGYLKNNHQADLVKLSGLRKDYLENPVNPKIVEEIERIKREIAHKLNQKFVEFLESKGVIIKIFDQTKPFHWALEFWHIFFDEHGNALEENLRDMDVVIGNPPYIKAKLMDSIIRRFLDVTYSSATASYDVYVVFIEKSFQLLGKNGYFGFINPSKFAFTDYGLGIRKLIEEKMRVDQFIDFGDAQIFDEATNYTCLLFLRKKNEGEYSFRVVKVKNKAIDSAIFVENLKKKMEMPTEFHEDDYEIFTTSSNALTADSWRLAPLSRQQLLEKIKGNNPCLEDFTYKIFVGLQITPVEVFALSMVQSLGEYVKVSPIKPEKEGEEYVIERALLVPVLKSSDIGRYFAHAKNYYVIFPYKFTGKSGQEFDAKFIEESEMKTKYPKTFEYLVKKRHFLETREEGRWKGSTRWYEYSRAQNFGCHPLLKIITPGISTDADYALDGDGYYIDRGSYGIVFKEGVNISYKYLLALLNSKVLDFALKSTSPFVSGGYYSYQTKYLNNLPIKTAVQVPMNEMELLVGRVTILKKAGYKFLEIWREWCTRLKNDEYSLEKILNEDARFTKTGMFDKTWTSKVTFYPVEHTMPNIIFSKFKITGKSDKNTIEIYGLDESNKEELVYEMEFRNRDLMLHVYCSLLEALRSKAKIKKVYDLLTKTAIPIIKEVNRSSNELTPNIIKKVRDEFEGWLRQNKIGNMEADIVKIDNEIEDLEAKIDALVFKLYNLNQSEINIVFDSLKTPTIYQGKVLEFFREL
jgi:type I restriction-modification system DNA methylase subunit